MKVTEKAKQPCPQCGFPIGVVAGTKDAICKNCGFKDACCQPQYDPPLEIKKLHKNSNSKTFATK